MPSMWSASTGERLPVELDALSGASAVAFSPSGRLIATAHAGGLVRVWSMPSPALPHARVPLAGRYATARFDRPPRLPEWLQWP